MDAVPRPDQLEAFLQDIEHDVGAVRDGYRWAYPDAYRRPKHASQELVSGGGEVDLADLVTATDRVRTKIREAAKAVLIARNSLGRAVSDLNDAMNLLEPPASVEVADVRFLAGRQGRLSVARAKAAKMRRARRADSSGDHSEVVG